MRGSARALRLAILAVLVLGPARTALAADGKPYLSADASIVRVYATGPPHVLDRLRVTVTELCARLNLSATVEEAPSESVLGSSAPRAFALAFVDFSSALPRVVVVDGETHREIERRTLPRASSLELSVEEAGHVLYMTVESSLRARERRREAPRAAGAPSDPEVAPEPGAAKDGEEPTDDAQVGGSGKAASGAATAREDEHATSREADSAPSRVTESGHGSHPSAFEAEVSAFGSAVAFGTAHVLPGLGASFDAGVRRDALRASASLSVGASFSDKVTMGDETASVRTDAGRLLAALEWEPTTRLAAFAGIGGGIDRVTVATTESPAGVWAAGATTRVDPVLEGLAGAKVLLSNISRVFVAMALDVDMNPHRYVLDEGGTRRTFFDSPRVRPKAFLGLSFLLSGAGGREARGDVKP